MLKHNAKKSGMQLMAVLVVIVLLSLIPRLETRAADNISIEDGILKWEPVNGAVKYWINARATDNNYINFQTVVTTTTCNLKEEMSHNRECWSGDYEVKIYAESSTGLPMGNYTVYYYGYEATMSQLDGCVPRFHGTKVEWDPVEHAARYTLLVWPGMSPTSTFPIQYVFGDVLYNGETDFDISDKIEPDLYYRASLRVQAENGYIDSRTFQSEAVKGQDLIDGYCSTITLSGHVTLDNTNPVPGEVIHISDISGYSSRISSEDLEYEWLVQKDGSDSFEFITDAYWGYNVQSDDKYVRLRITAKGCKGEIVSPDIRVAKGLAINLSTFPDDTFRSYIKDNFDNNPSDDKLSANELNKIAHIDVGWKGIKSLKGIENLYNVQEVYAYHNEIKNADFSGLERLWRVDLSENEELTSVDVTANMRLSQLNIADCTKLSDIDLSGNPYLCDLDTYRSKISKLDIRNNSSLVNAMLYGEKKDAGVYSSVYDWYQYEASDLRISSSTTVLLVSLDEEHFPSEEFRNQIAKDYDWNNDGILSDWEALDVKTLFPEDSEDLIRTLKGIEYFPNLTLLYATNCRVPYIDLSKNKKLTNLELGGNGLKALDIAELKELENLSISNNPNLETLDVSNNTKLTSLWCWGCGLSSLDLSANTKLVDLNCAENQITQLSVSGLTDLTYLSCGDNPIAALNVSNNKKLKDLNIWATKISKLDVSTCSDLFSLSCGNTGLTTIDVSKNKGLYRLNIDGTNIKTLDISDNEKLKSAYAGEKFVRTDSVTGATWDNYISAENSSWWMNVDTDTKIVIEKEHSWDAGVVTKEATCKEKGIKTYNCTRCGETKTEEIDFKPHTLTKVPAKAATENEEGNKEYYICSVCDKWFEDAEGTKEITDHSSVVIPKIEPGTTSPEATPKPDITRDTNDISPSNPVKVEEIEKTILNTKDEKDTKGSTFTLLKAKAAPKSKKSIKLSWSKVPGAEKYMIFGNKCGKKNKYKYITTVTGTSYTAKKLKKGTYYKYTIVAVKGDEAIATSKTIHVVTDGGKKGNNTKVKLSKTKLSLKVGKSKTIKAKLSSKKKVSIHRKVSWESDNLSVAKVNSKGKITAVGKGTCYVYAYAQNGVAAKIKITVK